jgi:hypothetical protein
MKQFEVTKSRSQEFLYLPESHYVTAWISGLRDDIKDLVLSQNYYSSLEIFQYAKHIEVALDYQLKRNKPVFKTQGILTSNNLRIGPYKEKIKEEKMGSIKENPKNSLIEHRWALGLCFKCEEKYFSEHQCKSRYTCSLSKKMSQK